MLLLHNIFKSSVKDFRFLNHCMSIVLRIYAKGQSYPYVNDLSNE